MTLLVADIGGTRARFAVYEQGRALHFREFTTAEFDGVTAATVVTRVLEAWGITNVAAICFAVAGPVIDGRASMTNTDLSFDEREISNALAVPVLVINDLVALGHAFNVDDSSVLKPIGESGAIRSNETRAIACAGTGLGMAILPSHKNGRAVVPSEGGHARIATVDAYERELVDAAEQELGLQAVTWEHFLSGPGLVNLYRAVAALWGSKPELLGPKEISTLGLSISDPVCHRTLETFCALFGTACGSLALTAHALGGVYVGGTVVAAIAPMLDESRFRRRFVNVGIQADILQSVPTVLFSEDSLGLQGAASYVTAALSSADQRDAGLKP
ncbi:MAG: glucokinase [Pseudomonadales bacterium]|nr:glucokinase [Pseudomonadales bacterium]